jgi:hypothetical protein
MWRGTSQPGGEAIATTAMVTIVIIFRGSLCQGPCCVCVYRGCGVVDCGDSLSSWSSLPWPRRLTKEDALWAKPSP